MGFHILLDVNLNLNFNYLLFKIHFIIVNFKFDKNFISEKSNYHLNLFNLIVYYKFHFMFIGQFIQFKLIINFIDFNYCLNHFKFNLKLINIDYFIINC